MISYDDQHLKTYELNDAVITLGRLPENTISIANMGISRRHLRIELDGDRNYVVTDLNSLNGVLINDVKAKSAILASGDRIAIGKYMIEFEIIDEPMADATGSDTEIRATQETPHPELDTVQTEGHIAQLSAAVDDDARFGATDSDGLDFSPSVPVLIETNKHVVYKLDKATQSMGNSELDDIFVSGFMVGDEHVIIVKELDGYHIRAKKMMGKFRVNGKKVSVHRLMHKDRIEIGNCTFRYMENE
jgi:pSer/pThr/pTyr-binding forkhead associated (FHA) protein